MPKGRRATASDGPVTRRDGPRSSSDPNDCVEIATTPIAPATVHIRDFKNSSGHHLAITPIGWRDFVTYASGS
ncbi:DUF397 domain-containing protein [Streptomyces sp. NPDC050147]|uniref:DUF397 domain-containing protein n=1 Tax=Streptomyces sp. NPDC050147 TaxID=3155513 RepID=UPI00342E087D